MLWSILMIYIDEEHTAKPKATIIVTEISTSVAEYYFSKLETHDLQNNAHFQGYIQGQIISALE